LHDREEMKTKEREQEQKKREEDIEQRTKEKELKKKEKEMRKKDKERKREKVFYFKDVAMRPPLLSASFTNIGISSRRPKIEYSTPHSNRCWRYRNRYVFGIYISTYVLHTVTP
jgi:hypothetical protein